MQLVDDCERRRQPVQLGRVRGKYAEKAAGNTKLQVANDEIRLVERLRHVAGVLEDHARLVAARGCDVDRWPLGGQKVVDGERPDQPGLGDLTGI